MSETEQKPEVSEAQKAQQQLSQLQFKTDFWLAQGNHKLTIYHIGPPKFNSPTLVQFTTTEGVHMVNTDHVVHCLSTILKEEPTNGKRIIVP